MLLDVYLVHAILTEWEDGDLPDPGTRILNLDLSDLGVPTSPHSAPSSELTAGKRTATETRRGPPTAVREVEHGKTTTIPTTDVR